MLTRPFELYLFTTDVALALEAIEGGAAGLVVDWEYKGKAERQRGYDTCIGRDTVDDLRRLRAFTEAPILCRINPFGPWTPQEVESAVEAGASELLLPMVRSREEVERALELVKGRIGLGILVETKDAVAAVEELASLPLIRVYLGLNDLAIDRGQRNIFLPLLDGTLERVRMSFRVPFGFGGLTLPHRGFPVPCRLLMGEMARLDCQFSFLRRSFLRDTAGRGLKDAIPKILAALEEAFARTPAQIEADRAELHRAVVEAEAFFASGAGERWGSGRAPRS